MDKKDLLELVKDKINEKIANLEKLIADKRASNNDTKSSMGDKYETSREMLQQEINNLLNQLKGFKDQEYALKSIKTETSIKAEKGALCETDRGLFYISASIGEIVFEGQKIICISDESPLAKAMHGKTIKEKFLINNQEQSIKTIW